MGKFFDLVHSDMTQAKLTKGNTTQNIFRFLISRALKVIIFTRLSQTSNRKVSYIAKYYLKRSLINIGSVEIGKGFYLPHPQCIIIASGVKIGEHVHIGQNVTIGGNFKKQRVLDNNEIQKFAIIGDRVMIHPGAVIGGPVTIGNDVIIGANSVITKDVPSNTIVFGQNQHADKKITIPSEGGQFEIMEKK